MEPLEQPPGQPLSRHLPPAIANTECPKLGTRQKCVIRPPPAHHSTGKLESQTPCHDPPAGPECQPSIRTCASHFSTAVYKTDATNSWPPKDASGCRPIHRNIQGIQAFQKNSRALAREHCWRSHHNAGRADCTSSIAAPVASHSSLGHCRTLMVQPTRDDQALSQPAWPRYLPAHYQELEDDPGKKLMRHALSP